MKSEMLAHSPLLVLPLLALFLFLGVFLVVVVRTMSRRPRAYASLSAMPLHDGEGASREEAR